MYREGSGVAAPAWLIHFNTLLATHCVASIHLPHVLLLPQGKPKRPFVQTFFLAVQEKGYYVLNDIFRC